MSVIKIAAMVTAALMQVPAFEVASVRPDKSNDRIQEFQIQPGGRLVIHGMPLKGLIRRAYVGSDAAQDESRVVGGPAWAASDPFDVIAKANGDLEFDAQGRPIRLFAMLKTLLEDRFKLKVHTESRDAAIYILVLANKDARLGSELHPSILDCLVFLQGVPRPAPDPIGWCGVRVGATGTTVRVTAHGVTMEELAKNLSGFRSVARPVVDTTKLTGRFDFDIEFTTGVAPTANLDVPPIGTLIPDVRPGLSTVLQEQLGLKLQAAKGAVDFVVIDHAERPAED